MKKVPCVLILLVTMLIASCSSNSVPSEVDGMHSFQSQLDRKFGEGFVDVQQFEKSNGQHGEILGIETYELDYEAIVMYPKGLNLRCKGYTKNPAAITCWDTQVLEVGTVQRATGTLSFEKTEKGWRGSGGNVY